MTADEIRAMQAPVKERYRETPEAALVTLKAEGRIGEGVTCKVETGKGAIEAGLHSATGGNGLSACSGDMLLEALVGCAGVTLNAVATALGIKLRDATVRAEGDLDFRGTLGVAKDAPVGFQRIRLMFDLDTDATGRPARDVNETDRALLCRLPNSRASGSHRSDASRDQRVANKVRSARRAGAMFSRDMHRNSTEPATLYRPGNFQLAPTVGSLYEVAPDIGGLRQMFVNVYFIGEPGSSEWTLVDAGLSGSAEPIIREAARRFGPNAKPRNILLTHGHFDHTGALRTLARTWGVDVYAHPLELPYLTGRSDYPPPDPTVGGGSMSWFGALFPKRGKDLSPFVKPLPNDGSVPGLPEWRWFHTPGHAPGHVSYFRQRDRALIAGDAFVTTRMESTVGGAQANARTQRPARLLHAGLGSVARFGEASRVA